MNLLYAGFLILGISCSSGPRERQHLEAAGALGPYSAAVISGEFCFVSGKIGTAEARGGTFEGEVESAITAVLQELQRAGLQLSDVVATTVYLTDMGLYQRLNEVYAQRFPRPYPARVCVGVAALPGDARVEIQVTAAF